MSATEAPVNEQQLIMPVCLRQESFAKNITEHAPEVRRSKDSKALSSLELHEGCLLMKQQLPINIFLPA